MCARTVVVWGVDGGAGGGGAQMVLLVVGVSIFIEPSVFHPAGCVYSPPPAWAEVDREGGGGGDNERSRCSRICCCK